MSRDFWIAMLFAVAFAGFVFGFVTGVRTERGLQEHMRTPRLNPSSLV